MTRFQEHLLQLDMVSDDQSQTLCEPGAQRDVLVLELGTNQRRRFNDNLVDIQPNPLCCGFCSERADPFDHLVGAHRISYHSFDRAARRLNVRDVVREIAKTRISATDHPGQRLVDFVRNRGGQFAHGRHAANMSDLRLRNKKRVFGALAFDELTDLAAYRSHCVN